MTLPQLSWASWQRVLVVVAHPDDAEYGLSAAVHEWTNAGIEVSYLLLTGGEAGMQRSPDEARAIRAHEQRAACDEVGVRDLTILDEPDGVLEYGTRLRMHVARHVRRVRPDVVITANFAFEAYGGLNQADHRAAGLAAVDGTRDAANRWVFSELADEGLEPWQARGLLVAADAAPTHAVSVSQDAVAAAVRSFEAHQAYLEELPEGFPPPSELVPGFLTAGGSVAGVAHAMVFRVFDLGGLLE